MKEESKTRLWAALAVAVMFGAGVIGIGGPGPGRGGADGDPHGPRGGHPNSSDGVMVRASEVAGGGQTPRPDRGLREGDIITHINRE